jgi:hypothetical protein
MGTVNECQMTEFQLFSQKDQLSLYLLPSGHTKLHAKFVCLKCKYLREY